MRRNPPSTVSIVSISAFLVICAIGIALFPRVDATASWQTCIVDNPASCPNDCVNAGYLRNKTTNLCMAPPYSFCFNPTALPGVCDSAQPTYYLQACLDYGFKLNTADGSCTPPTCIDQVNPCPTTTTYCADQAYTNLNNVCNCTSPLKDYNGQCTNIVKAFLLYVSPLFLLAGILSLF